MAEPKKRGKKLKEKPAPKSVGRPTKHRYFDFGLIRSNYICRGKAVIAPVIYGIYGYDSGDIVYVGQTQNILKRMSAYIYVQHNAPLADWMSTNRWSYTILDFNPKSINDSERKWIVFLKDQLFNMTNGDEKNWKFHKRLPWSGGRGVKCPSELLMFFLKNRGHADYKKLNSDISGKRDRMTIKQRCLYELELCKEHYHSMMTNKFELWLSQTESKLVEAINAS